MKAPLIRRWNGSKDARRRERGITMALVAASMVAIIGMAMIAIDLVTLFLAREEAQRAADTAALTAARIISVSGITGTASPSTQTTYWQSVCGAASGGNPGGIATQAALAAGGQNSVGSVSPTKITVTYATAGANGASSSDCSTLSSAFAVNPLVTVQVQRTNLPTFFSRYWGYGGQSVTVSATAEAFNPSASDVNNNGGNGGQVTPVQPRCVKPWIVPNQNPLYPSSSCTGAGCDQFVTTGDGQIQHAGITTTASGQAGVIGEQFWLLADCGAGSDCKGAGNDNPPVANTAKTTLIGGGPPSGPNLEYLPGESPATTPVAVPSCAPGSAYQQAVAGCDQGTAYQCGVSIANQNAPGNAVDLKENPGGATGDTAVGLACALANQSSGPLNTPVLDALDVSGYPFKIQAGLANPTKIVPNTQISGSNSIVSLPIYDSTSGNKFNGNGGPVAIVGFLQVFINQIDATGNIQVTVLNVAGCGDITSGNLNNPVTGSSPVPVRLVTPPSS